MVIVGDEKQLSPTNFFRMVSADDEEEGEQTTPTGKTRDWSATNSSAASTRRTPAQRLRYAFSAGRPLYGPICHI